MVYTYLLRVFYLNLNLINECAVIDFLSHGTKANFLSDPPHWISRNHSYLTETHTLPPGISDVLQGGVQTLHAQSTVTAESA